MPRWRRSLFPAVAAMASFACVAPVRELHPPHAHEPSVTVYVVSHGWHAGLVVPRDAISPRAWPERDHFPEARYLEIGWGDRAFYQAPRPTAALALRTIFRSGGSVLHVVGFTAPVPDAFPAGEIVAVDLSARGFEELARYIQRSYARDSSGYPIRLGQGLYGTSEFYLATGRYHLLNTCNNWIAGALRAAGCPITPGYAITAGNLLYQARKFGRPIRASGVPATPTCARPGGCQARAPAPG